MPKPLHLFGFALTLISLAACERKSPTSSLPATAPPITARPDTTRLTSGLAQDSLAAAAAIAAPESLPPNAAPGITKSKLVAPDLAVTISGTYPTDDERVKPKRTLLIKQHERVIYTDTTADFLYEEPFKSGI
jgi:hypothetical protein